MNVYPIIGLSDKPAFAPADFHRVQGAIKDWIKDLVHLLPALNHAQKLEITSMLDLESDAKIAPALTIDDVKAQYLLVLKIRDMVLDPAQNFTAQTDARGLAALVSSINGVINLFLRYQDKLNTIRENTDLREAVIFAISELSPEVQAKFFAKLDELA